MMFIVTSVTSYVLYRLSGPGPESFFIEKGVEILPCSPLPPRSFFLSGSLSTETQLLDDGPVSLDVHLLKVVQKLAALTDQAEKGTTGDHVLLVLLHVLGKVSDTVGK
jgi:hypothetical protein